tara:strand:- start:7384 stop:8151 length:768 start_codon:yes stop_codon:yes gene_type:complete
MVKPQRYKNNIDNESKVNDINLSNSHAKNHKVSTNVACSSINIEKFNNNSSGLVFSINNKSFNKKQTSVYANQPLQADLSIDNLFSLSNNIYHAVVNKIENSNFKVKDNESNKFFSLAEYFTNIDKNIKDHLTVNEERIYYGKVVVFEDVYQTSPVFRLSFHSLKDADFQLKFKAHSNTHHPEIKKLYNLLLQIPSKYKKRVAKNSGRYTLGKSVFIRGVLKENATNMYFTDIKDIWLCDADNKYDKMFELKQFS